MIKIEKTAWMTGVAVLAVAMVGPFAQASTTLTVGGGASNIELQAETASQTIDLFLSSDSGQAVGGANIVLDLGAGGPSIVLGSQTGTLYDGGGSALPDLNTDAFGINQGLLFPFPSPTLDNTGTQKLATIVFDTTGLNSGTFNLNFTGTTVNDGVAQPITFGSAGATSVTIVPEPGSLALLGLGGLALLRRRR